MFDKGLIGLYADTTARVMQIPSLVERTNRLQNENSSEVYEWQLLGVRDSEDKAGIIEVTDETTIGAVERLRKEYGKDKKICMLNFASAKDPGGLWASGSKAQEESLCYSSNLFWSLRKCLAVYQWNRANLRRGLYTNNMIYSTDVTVIRDKDYNLLNEEDWYYVDCLSSAAPNRIATMKNGIDEREVQDAMLNRINRILQVARAKGVEVLVLGAFGCGVFRHSPSVVAELFKRELIDKLSRYDFEKVVFAVPAGRDMENYTVFHSTLGNK